MLLVAAAALAPLAPGKAAPHPRPQSASAPSAATVATSASTQNPPEMSSHDSPTTFQVNVRLVEVRVVVRDVHGDAVGNLRKEDFQLFDDRKPQAITQFSVERPGFEVAREQKTTDKGPASTSGPASPPDIPERYLAYLFDDVHLVFSDLAQAREAAEKNLRSLRPTDRAALFTTSGQNQLDFTDDREKLSDALRRLLPRPIIDNTPNPCPKMTYYLADLIANKNDPRALAAVTSDALACQFNNDPRLQNAAQAVAESTASQWLTTGDAETHLALTSLKETVRRVSILPGQRSIVLVSPGFLTPQRESDIEEIADRAVRGNVTISGIDARGLYVLVPGGDISQQIPSSTFANVQEAQYQQQSATADSDVMAFLADATGGAFVHNTNDLAEGFRQLASAPEYYYLLGFAPQKLKLNGRFHNLKVTVNGGEKYSVRARRGYFAPKQPSAPELEAKQEIEDAVFSQEEVHELPIDLHTQFFKPSDTDAKLTVLAHVDVKQLHFHKEDGRNNSDLTIVYVIFDRNGNFVSAIEKTLRLHLKDDTLANRMGPGLSVKSNFDIKPGSYLVRLVARDAEGQIAAENGAVQIP